MKVGILRPPIGIGGAEMSLTEMGANLRENGFDVWMHFNEGSHSSVKSFNQFGSLNKRCSENAKAFFHKDSFSEKWAINNLKDTDIVIIIHRHLFNKRLSDAINKVSKKIVYCPGKNEHHVFGYAKGTEIFGKNISNIKNFIFNSGHTLNLHLSKSYSQDLKKRFKHIHPPMDMGYYGSFDIDKLRSSGRKNLSIPSNQFAIGIFGRMIPSKQPENVVEIANKIRRRHSTLPFKFYFIGDGPKRSDTQKLINKYGLQDTVTILGMKDFPFECIAAMDTVLHLCDHESMSRALRESMFFGKPVIAFKGAGNIELCTGESSKLLFQNHGQAASMLILLAKNKRKREIFAKASRNRILSMESKAVKDLISFLESK